MPMDAGEYELTRGTCFVAHRLEVIAVGELLWISWCTLNAGKVGLCERVRMHRLRRRAGLRWRGAAAMRLDRKVEDFKQTIWMPTSSICLPCRRWCCPRPRINHCIFLYVSYMMLFYLIFKDVYACKDKRSCCDGDNIYTRCEGGSDFPPSCIRSLFYVWRINNDEFGRNLGSFDSLGF